VQIVEGQPGTVRISPHVLATIARLTTLSVPGVLQMYTDLPGGLNRWFKGRSGSGDGVRVEVVDEAVSVDVHIVAARNVNLYELGQEIQTLVSRAIQDMVGMPVLAVNVHVEDVQIGSADG
jgi:uncharacterized alkaline shock family protein YloU